MKKIILAAALVALSSGAAHAATAAGSATATVISPITIAHVATASLNFGTFDAGSGGTVTVTAAGAGTASGVNFVLGSVNGADGFNVTGDTTRSFNITTTGGNVTSGANTMAFTTTPSAATGTLVAGLASFTVGGVLTVTSGQAIGSYTGSYNATVVYQ